MAKKQYQRDTAEKTFEILLNRFGSGVQGHQAMMRFEKRRQREDETIEKFLDDLEMLRRRSQPDESNRRMNLAVASKFIDGVKNDELRTMLATHYTPLSTNAPTPEELRLKSKEYLLLKPPSRSGYYKNNYGNFNNGPANQGNNWYKPRDDMDKRRSCANCSSTDHHVSACPAYKQGMKAIGFSLEDEDASELDHEDFMRGVIAKFGPRCFFCNLEGHFKSDCPQFWDAVAEIKHPRHEEALSGVKASKARLLSEAEARRKDKPQELAAKKMQAVTEETREPEPATAADDFKIDYRAAARDALNRLQQELVTKEIEQKVRLELENEKVQEQLNTFEATEFEETKVPSSLSMKLNVISGQRFGMVPQGSKIQSIISVAGHQVIRNLSEPSEFTLMHLDTYADYLRQVEPRTESRAVRAQLTTGGPRMKPSQSSVILSRSFSVTRNGLCVSVLLNTLDTTFSIQRGKKLGYALPMRTDYEETQNLKEYSVKNCPYHANKDKILKRINELKSIHKLFSMKSETDDGLSSCSNFPERPSSYELESDKPVLPEIEHLKGKIGEGDFEKLRDLLNRNADVFSKYKADIGCCNFVEHEIELEEGAVPHREGVRRMTPHKSEACRAEIEMLLEYDMIEPSKSPWACGVLMAKKKGGSLDFVVTFVT